MKQRVAIIVPRCAETAYGGAELLAMRLAQELRERFAVEILTTCATDYWTWENVLPPGRSEVEGVNVRRFPVDAARDLREFDRLSRSFRFRIQSLTTAEQEAWIRAEGPYSTPLWQFLFEERTAYDCFVFMPYSYATTYFGLPIVRERSVLLPLAHDEWQLYFPVWRQLFRYARAFGFLTPEERQLLRQRFADDQLVGDILYPRLAVNGTSASAPPPSATPFMLYLGRIDASKGVPDLTAAFLAHLAAVPDSAWHLKLAGPRGSGDTAIPQHDRITYLGAVDETAKWSLLQQCSLVTMPSLHESLSIALIEGWLARRAALVNGRSPVLVGQVRRANGGLWYDDAATFSAALLTLDEQTRERLGEQGFDYVERTYVRGNTLEFFEDALHLLRPAAQTAQ